MGMHRAAVIFVGSDGKVVRYLHGSDFKPAGFGYAIGCRFVIWYV